MRVLLTGGHGFVGSQLRAVFTAHGADVIAPTHVELDACDGDAVARAVDLATPDAIVHAAIWNDPPELSTDRRRAWDAYVGATRHVVRAAGEIPVVLISTDWVFAGDGGAPYAEHDPPCPVNAYGFLKAASELVVTERASHGIVARIAGAQGPSADGHPHRRSAPRSQDAGFGYFVAALVDSLRAGRPFTVWDGPGVNVRATPTLASDAGELIWRALSIATTTDGSGHRRVPPILHCCGGESVDRLGLARRAAGAFDLDAGLIEPGQPPPGALGSEPVPVDTRLDATATAAALDIPLPGLDAMLTRLRKQLDGVAAPV